MSLAARLAALAAIWPPPPISKGGGAAAKPTSDDVPATTPARRSVDPGMPPLTRAETCLVAALLTLWCGAPYWLSALGAASLLALALGRPAPALCGLAALALAFAPLLLPLPLPCPWPALRRGRLLSLVRRYFSYSVAVSPTAPALDPHKPYLFASYPHGAYPLAQLLGMTCHEEAGWPGRRFLGGAASAVFWCPGWRQGMRWLGCVPADRAALLRALRDERASVGLAPGGVAEMYLYAPGGGGGGGGGGRPASSSSSRGFPSSFLSGAGGSGSGGGSGKQSDACKIRGSSSSKSKRAGNGTDDDDDNGKSRGGYKNDERSDSNNDDGDNSPQDQGGAFSSAEHAVILQRRGFVSLAVEAGADIVPVYYFGNSLLFRFGPRWLERLGRRLRVSLGLLLGEGNLPCPRRVRLMQAIGAPVPVPRRADGGGPLERGTPEFAAAVESVHAAYRAELVRTYETFRPIYDGGALWEQRPLILH